MSPAPQIRLVASHPAARWVAEFVLWLLVVGLVASLYASCSTIKRVGLTGGPVAGAAAAGALAGPAVAAAAAGVTAVVMVALVENGELRSGEIVGEEALSKQVILWRGRAYEAEEKVRELGDTSDWWRTWMWRGLGVLALAFVWRNREHLFQRGGGVWGYVTRIGRSFFGPAPALRRKSA